MAEHLSRRAYARSRNLHESSVRRAIASGKIKVDKRNMIDPAQADRAWATMTDLSKPRNAVTGNPKRRREEDDDGGLGSYVDPEVLKLLRSKQKSAAVSAIFRARRDELEFKLLEGSVVKIDDVVSKVYAMTRRTRDLLLSIPDRMAATLSGTDATTAHRLLTEEIRHVLAEISTKPLLPPARPVRGKTKDDTDGLEL